jgi:hypothetical protein
MMIVICFLYNNVVKLNFLLELIIDDNSNYSIKY